MRARQAIAWAALILAPLALGACSKGGFAGNLRAAGVGGAPDEFLVLPTRPLEMPKDFSTLPPPTPGQPNRVDYRPKSEAIAGLTGRPAAATVNGAALVAAAGPSISIRPVLAAEDVTWRQTHHGKLLERLFSHDQEALVYAPMVLNAPGELVRLRAVGVEVPAASPSAMGQ